VTCLRAYRWSRRFATAWQRCCGPDVAPAAIRHWQPHGRKGRSWRACTGASPGCAAATLEPEEPLRVGDLIREGGRIAVGIVAAVAPLAAKFRGVSMHLVAGEMVRRLRRVEPACGLPIAAKAVLGREAATAGRLMRCPGLD
jgi:hypothetical protein